MPTFLAHSADILVTMDDAGRETHDGGLYARDGRIEHVGPSRALPKTADKTLDLSGHVVVPGLVNTHHHLYQNLTRVVPAGQDQLLFGWLKSLYPIWARMGPEHIRASALVGLAELMLSGCTTTSDHLYMFPNGARLDDEIDVAREIGIRFTATRGAMSIGESAGGLPPDSVVEKPDAILGDCERVIAQFHDPSPLSMLRVALAPCSPFSVSRELMRDTAILAARHKVGLHTHLAENAEDIAYSLATFGVRPGQYVEEAGWTGPHVWHAHCCALDDAEIGLFSRTGTGIAHCPTSNMRLGSGIAPIRKMLDRGVKIGLGVDGSASNDRGDLMLEARMAMLAQRAGGNAAGLTAREVLRIATRGGAAVLGRGTEIGQLAPGFAADFVAFPVDPPQMAGTEWDPVAGLVFCAPQRAGHVVINGRPVVVDGRIVTIDVREALARHRRLALDLVAAS
jgi:cytosine/adenosine deaminase-related metal-dependent hydrolase